MEEPSAEDIELPELKLSVSELVERKDTGAEEEPELEGEDNEPEPEPEEDEEEPDEDPDEDDDAAAMSAGELGFTCWSLVSTLIFLTMMIFWRSWGFFALLDSELELELGGATEDPLDELEEREELDGIEELDGYELLLDGAPIDEELELNEGCEELMLERAAWLKALTTMEG